MRFLLALCLVAFAIGEELLVTQAYTDYLKNHVTWEVVDYEDNIFRGWTIEEFQELLIPLDMEEDVPSLPELVSDDLALGDIDWIKMGGECVHDVGDQGRCGSCWAFAVASMAADRCCLQTKKNHGWLSPQELVSCDRHSDGCNGGIRDYAIDYVVSNGLVPETCYRYLAKNTNCPSRCDDGSDWKGAHVCKCKKRVNCVGVNAMYECLKSGPISTGFIVYQDFQSYKSGVYHWDKRSGALGGHAVRCYGYSEQANNKNDPHWKCFNSWGKAWGTRGLFDIGVNECGISTRQPGYCDPK